MCIELKIKSKHLSLESKVIRFEEHKLQKQLSWIEKNLSRSDNTYNDAALKLASLTDHRKRVVGRENRATFLARCFLAGEQYAYAEKSRRQEREWEFQAKVLPRVLEMVKKYGPYETRKHIALDDIKEWSKLPE